MHSQRTHAQLTHFSRGLIFARPPATIEQKYRAATVFYRGFTGVYFMVVSKVNSCSRAAQEQKGIDCKRHHNY